MKRNYDKFEAAINFNPTKRSQTMTIQDLNKRIEEGGLTVPLYQRGLSWNDDKAIALFNYQLFGKAPVAPISLNEIGTHDEVPQLNFISREQIDGENQGKLSVVDGQQRLTTNYKAYSNDSSFEKIALDLSQSKFRKRKKMIEIKFRLVFCSTKIKRYYKITYIENGPLMMQRNCFLF